MTQVKGAQGKRGQFASNLRGRQRTLAQRRAELEAQMRAHVDASMAVTDLPKLSERLKALRDELARKRGTKVQQYAVAQALDVPPRTFQSWENGEVETEGKNYDAIAAFYSRELGRPVTRNWILYGQDEVPPPLSEPPADEPELRAEVAKLTIQIQGLREQVDRILAELLDQHRAAAEDAARELEADEEAAASRYEPSDASSAEEGRVSRNH